MRFRSLLVGTSNKTPTGIIGLDEITGVDLPRGRTTLLAGGQGSGNTLLALQFLVYGAQHCKEPGISVAFEAGVTLTDTGALRWEKKSAERVAHEAAKVAAKLSLPGWREIEIVDVFQEPERAVTEGIFMTPTLVKLAPARLANRS